MLLELIVSALAEAEATATPIAHVAEAAPKAYDPLLMLLLGILGGSVVPVALFLFGRIHHQGDRQTDQDQAAVGREVHHIERAEDRDERASNRELDMVRTTLQNLENGLSALRASTASNHSECQVALLRIETGLAAVTAYVESEKELRRIMGVARAGVN